MRILKVTQAYYPFQERGGPAIKVRSIARALTEKGHQVTVLTADLGLEADQIAAVSAVRDGDGWRSNLDQVETVYFPTRCSYRNLTLNSGVRAFCRTRLRQFDIVHIYGLYDLLGPAVARYCRRFGVPYFIEPLGMTRPIDRGFLLKRLWWASCPRYLPGAHRIVATSEMERDELIADSYSPHRILLRYNGIDREQFSALPPSRMFREKWGLSDEERYIIFLGRLIPRKGADLLIEALASLPRSCKLVIAGPEGEAGYLSNLKSKARTLGIEGRVIFCGPLYGEDKKSAFCGAWVFALPSRYENFGNSAAEAIACGTPAVVSDRCGIAPLIDGRAGLVTSYAVASVAGTLTGLLESPALYQRLKAGCGGVADELWWDRIVQQFQLAYDEARNDVLRSTPV